MSVLYNVINTIPCCVICRLIMLLPGLNIKFDLWFTINMKKQWQPSVMCTLPRVSEADIRHCPVSFMSPKDMTGVEKNYFVCINIYIYLCISPCNGWHDWTIRLMSNWYRLPCVFFVCFLCLFPRTCSIIDLWLFSSNVDKYI